MVQTAEGRQHNPDFLEQVRLTKLRRRCSRLL